jgi:hypothetical protein
MLIADSGSSSYRQYALFLIFTQPRSRPAAIGSPRQPPKEETQMATPDRRIGGISVGGILVIAGLLMMFIWSFLLGLIVALIGLVAFGGFVRGKWY